MPGGRKSQCKHRVSKAGIAFGHRGVGDRQCRSKIVVDNRGGALSVVNRRAVGQAQVQEERLVLLVKHVAVDRHRDQLRGRSSGEGQRAGRGCEVGRRARQTDRHGRSVGGGVLDRDGLGSRAVMDTVNTASVKPVSPSLTVTLLIEIVSKMRRSTSKLVPEIFRI